MNRILLTSIIGFSLAITLSAPLGAQQVYENSASLKGIDKIQVYFDVNVKDDNLLAFRMDMIDRTIKGMVEAGVEVEAVIGFRGKASRFITKDEHYVLREEVVNKKKIQDWIAYFSDRGIIVEQCAIAAAMNHIEVDDFLPDVTVVGNGYISMAAYQSRGFAVIPMD
jgi:intracellular sulfur oxidation DsrE/DsrF family protein